MLTAISVAAQSARSKITNIPFDFIVGEKTLPAGEYTFEPNRRDSDNVWLIQSRKGNASVLVATISVRANQSPDETQLVFRKYGDQYFLSQIWTPGGNTGRELLITRSERELAKNGIEREKVVVTRGAHLEGNGS